MAEKWQLITIQQNGWSKTRNLDSRLAAEDELMKIVARGAVVRCFEISSYGTNDPIEAMGGED